MAKPIPTSNCRHCGVDLSTTKRNGARCMKCYYEVIKKKRKKLKTMCVEYHGNKCADCGQSYPEAVYDFHHINDDKDGCVGNMTHNCRPFDVITEELDKCVMLCANCHRVRHFA